jgi:GntR family transcriptional regulator
LFTIDNQSRQPVYEQVTAQFEKFLLKGIIKPREQMPSVRNLSIELNINPNTIQKAYAELDRRGLLVSVPGRGSFVSDKAKTVLMEKKIKELNIFREMAEEFKLAGIEKDQIISEIEEAYKKENDE